MSTVRSMMPALLALMLSAGTGAFAQGNSAANHGNGNSHADPPAWGRLHPVPLGIGLGIALGESMLVPAADLPADLFTLLPSPPGNDPLMAGAVSVRAAGSVGVTIDGALTTQSYDVWFCHYSSAPDHCALLGTAQTDANGRVKTSFSFLAPGTSAAGVFAVVRNNAVQYVSGFKVPTAANQGVPISLEGMIGVVTLSTQSFTLQNTSLVIMTDATTVFTGFADLAALTSSSLVKVEGTLRPNGTVLAASVTLE